MNTPDAKQKTRKKRSNDKSTATQAQYERIVSLLRTGDKNTNEFRRAGIMMPAARIKELNDRHGYSIPTVDRIALWDECGFWHGGVAVYSLVSEPL